MSKSFVLRKNHRPTNKFSLNVFITFGAKYLHVSLTIKKIPMISGDRRNANIPRKIRNNHARPAMPRIAATIVLNISPSFSILN